MLRDQKISFRRYINDGGAGKKEGRGLGRKLDKCSLKSRVS